MKSPTVPNLVLSPALVSPPERGPGSPAGSLAWVGPLPVGCLSFLRDRVAVEQLREQAVREQAASGTVGAGDV